MLEPRQFRDGPGDDLDVVHELLFAHPLGLEGVRASLDVGTMIEDVEANYDLEGDRVLECTYSRSVFDDNAFVWGDDDLRTEVEDETGHLLYGTGWKRLGDLGRSLWRDLDCPAFP